MKDLKASSPTAYYSLAGGLAAAAGLVAWPAAAPSSQPRHQARGEDEAVRRQARAEDRRASGTRTSRTSRPPPPSPASMDLGDAGRLTGSVTANSATGFDNARVQYDFNRPNLNLSAYAHREPQRPGGRRRQRDLPRDDNLNLSAGVNHNFQTDRTTATAEASWKVNKDVDFALSASHDSAGDSRIGAGVKSHSFLMRGAEERPSWPCPLRRAAPRRLRCRSRWPRPLRRLPWWWRCRRRRFTTSSSSIRTSPRSPRSARGAVRRHPPPEDAQTFPDAYSEHDGVFTFRGGPRRTGGAWGVIPREPHELSIAWERGHRAEQGPLVRRHRVDRPAGDRPLARGGAPLDDAAWARCASARTSSR